MKEIDIREIPGVKLGQVEDAAAATGVTVVLSADPNGMAAGLDVRGGGPASRETELLKPLAAAQVIHAVVLGGGSAFGLDAAGGVMQYLEERGVGFDVGVTRVPLVVQSDIFDLGIGWVDLRPDRAMGYAACVEAEQGNYQDGCFGAGAGATVGKVCGMRRAMRSGIGSYAVQVGNVQIGAVMVVNALGEVIDWHTGGRVAGMLNEERTGMEDCAAAMYAKMDPKERQFAGNTTIGVVITNARFDKARLCKIAGMAHDGMARAIRPVHTTEDGDAIYALSVGSEEADQDVIGALAADVVAEAILRAVRNARGSHGLKAACDLLQE